MERSLGAAISIAESILSESHATLVTEGSAALQGYPTLIRKLAAIYAEEAAKPNRIKQPLIQTGRLLTKLVEREKLSCLVTNLYKGNEGYSIALKLPGGLETETIRLPYEDDELLTYIDQEQLPPMLLDLLDEAGATDLFHQGCVIAEIRDYRRCNSDLLSNNLSSSFSDTRHVLLKPTMQSIAADVAFMTRDKDWTESERLKIEAEIVKVNAPPLCLSPDISTSLLSRRLNTHTRAINNPALRRAVKRTSQPALNRQKKFEEGPAPKSLRLFNFLNEKKEKRLAPKNIKLPSFPTTHDNPLEFDPSKLFTEESVPNKDNLIKKITEDIKKFAKPREKPAETESDNSLHFVEEHTLETEKGQGRLYLTRLTIHKRKTDEVYLGELYVDRDYQEGKNNGSTCTFTHTSLASVHRYIAQFREIFSEEGRKSVKITHVVAGQPPRVRHIAGSRDRVVNQQDQHVRIQTQPFKQQGGNIVQASSSSGLPISYKPPNLLIVASDRSNITGSSHIVGGAITTVASSTHQGVMVCRAPTPVLQQQLSANSNTRLHHSNVMSHSVTPQQVVLGRNVQLSSLLGGRVTNVLQHTTQSGQKVTQMASVSLANKVSDSSIRNTGNVPALQALLADTPSAENPAPHPRGPTLLERLSQPNKCVDSQTVKLDITAGALPTITTINCSTTTNSLVTGSSPHPSPLVSSPASAVLRSDSGAAPPPPNINIANIANLPGLNVGLQNLTNSLSGIQTVQVSIPGLPNPISLSVSGGNSHSSAPQLTSTNQQSVILTSPQQQPSGHVVHVPIVQQTSQLAAQLTKTPNTSLNIMQGNMSGNSNLLGSSSSAGQSTDTMVSSSGLLTRGINNKQPQYQLTIHKQLPSSSASISGASKLSQQLQQKLVHIAANSKNHQQKQQQQQGSHQQ